METKKQFIKRLRSVVEKIKKDAPDIDRMSAWKAAASAGCEVPWEMFKRIWGRP